MFCQSASKTFLQTTSVDLVHVWVMGQRSAEPQAAVLAEPLAWTIAFAVESSRRLPVEAEQLVQVLGVLQVH